MANYCSNYIRIYKLSSSQKNQFSEVLKNYNLMEGLLHTFVPFDCGKDVIELDWRYNNWGTKWDLQEPTYYIDDNVVEISAWTPWSPPVAGLTTISRKFPNAVITLSYNEPGNDFAGKALYKNGLLEEVEEVYSEIKNKWLEENHPELYKQYSNDDEVCDKVDDLWSEVENSIIEEYLDDSLTTRLEDLIFTGS